METINKSFVVSEDTKNWIKALDKADEFESAIGEIYHDVYGDEGPDGIFMTKFIPKYLEVLQVLKDELSDCISLNRQLKVNNRNVI